MDSSEEVANGWCAWGSASRDLNFWSADDNVEVGSGSELIRLVVTYKFGRLLA